MRIGRRFRIGRIKHILGKDLYVSGQFTGQFPGQFPGQFTVQFNGGDTAPPTRRCFCCF